jgi:hypothetical protein
MQIHYIKSNGTVSNWPILENGETSIPFEISEEDYALSQTQDWKFELQGEELKVVEDVEGKARRAKEELDAKKAKSDALAHKLSLISKISAGTATKEEQEEFANLI